VTRSFSDDGAPAIGFLVNGNESSAMGYRARAFADRLAHRWRIAVHYRTGGRVASVWTFLEPVLKERPLVTWVFDMAFAGVVAAALGRSRGTRMVVDTGDAITALARQSGIRGPAGLAATAVLEQLAMATADTLVVRGTEHQRLLERQGRQSTLIPDGVDLAPFASVPPRAVCRTRLGFSDELVVGMVGSMVWSPVLNLTYGWDVIEALGMLKDLPVVAVLVGDGSGRAQLETRAAALGVSERVRFLGHRPFESLPEILAACDVCVSTQTNDIVGRVRTTGKLPLYMASGRYVLASRVGEAARVLPAEMLLDYSGSVDREYPARLAARLRHLSADRARLGLGETLIDRARQEFAYDVLAPRVDAVVTGLLPVPVAVPA
jgi:glycosyltransferase involved in cell wall biosynthesis